MKEVKVKVFDAYSADIDDYKNYGIDEQDLLEYHNEIVTKYGKVLPNKIWRDELPQITPLEKDLKEKTKYELDEGERLTLSMLKDTEKQLKNLYDSAKRKREKYERILLNYFDDELYDGEHWDCKFSPLGHCIYHYEYDEPTCIFCGEPEERK